MTVDLDLSMPDWAERLATGRSIVPAPLNPVEGNRAVAVFDRLRLFDVPGTPLLADACGDWFRDIVRVLFGSLDPVTKRRQIRELLLLVPKKNSKTTSGALLMLTALLLNQRPNAPYVMTGPVHDTAQLAYDTVAGAIELDEGLKARFLPRDHLKTIEDRRNGATLKIFTFDPATLTGQKVVGALLDEIHVCAKMARASSALRQIRGGMLPYPEAFLCCITTQSEEEPIGVFKDMLTHGRDVRDGKVKGGHTLYVGHEFPRELQLSGEWRDPKFWPLVTPNLGRSITIEALQEGFAVAQRSGEAELRGWASQHLNVEIGLALASNAWAGAEHWEPCRAEFVLTLDELLKRSEVVTAGVDGGGLDDLLGLVVIGRTADGKWLLWVHAWASPQVLQRRKDIAAKLEDLEKAGDLTIAPIGDDIRAVADVIEQCEDAGLLERIGVDPIGIGALIDELAARGIEENRIVAVPQGYKLNGAIKTMERKLASREIVHGGQPLMAWCVQNAKPELRGSAIVITKQVAGSGKIDALMAAFNAVALMSLNPKPKKKAYTMFFVGS